jgi:hypothetical protein
MVNLIPAPRRFRGKQNLMQRNEIEKSDALDKSIAFYTTAPELRLFREEFGLLLDVLYPDNFPSDEKDPLSFWELWQCVLGMTSDKKFSNQTYWAGRHPHQ